MFVKKMKIKLWYVNKFYEKEHADLKIVSLKKSSSIRLLGPFIDSNGW